MFASFLHSQLWPSYAEVSWVTLLPMAHAVKVRPQEIPRIAVLGSGDVGGTSSAREQFWAISQSESHAIRKELHPWKLINGTRLEVWPPGGVRMSKWKSNRAQPVQGKAFQVLDSKGMTWQYLAHGNIWQLSYYKRYMAFRFFSPTSQEVPPAAAAKLSGIPSLKTLPRAAYGNFL